MHKCLNSEWYINLSDEELVSECKTNKVATSILISRYVKKIAYLAQKRSSNKSDIDDLMQEGFMGLFNAIASYRNDKGAKFSTYANVCITNKMTNALIKNTNKDASLDVDINECESSIIYNFETPESILIEKEKLKELNEKIISLLSKKEWEIFQLFLKNSTYEQMASQLNIPVKVVDNAMQRVRRKLKSVWSTDNSLV